MNNQETTSKSREQIIRSLWPPTCHGRWMQPEYQPGLVSVIVPTYNRSSMVTIALDSVWNQTSRPIELLVVDDGSTDDTKAVVSKWMEDHANDTGFTTRYIQQSNTGAPSARNNGLINSRGEFIQFLDSDDVLHPQKIEIHKCILDTHKKIEITWAQHSFFNIETEIPDFKKYNINKIIMNSDYFGPKYFIEMGGNPRSTFYKRSQCLAVGPWNERLKRWQDLEYVIRMSAISLNVCHTDIVLAYEGVHNKQRIRNLSKLSTGIDEGILTLDEIDKFLSAFNSDKTDMARRRIANYYINLMMQALRIGNDKQFIMALDGAIKNRNSIFFAFKTRILLIIYRLLGPRIALNLASFYSNTRVNN